MESLLQLVETLKQRIAEHGGALRQSEAQTRYALIDPLLRELGWDNDDPGQVVPEYRTGNLDYGRANSRADYALLSAGNPAVMVEAKKLNESLQEGLEQGILYSIRSGSKYFVLTDGRTWEVYNLRGEYPAQPEVKFDLVEDSPAEVCRKAFALWRPSAEAGQLLAGQTPVVSPPTVPTKIEDKEVSGQASPDPIGNYDWKPLATLDVRKGEGSRHPVEILFPNNSTTTVGAWYEMLVEVVRWLSANDSLSSPLPMKDYPDRFLLNKEPTHPDGSPMRTSVSVSGWFISKNGTAQQMLGRTRSIINHANQDPAEFKVRFS